MDFHAVDRTAPSPSSRSRRRPRASAVGRHPKFLAEATDRPRPRRSRRTPLSHGDAGERQRIALGVPGISRSDGEVRAAARGGRLGWPLRASSSLASAPPRTASDSGYERPRGVPAAIAPLASLGRGLSWAESFDLGGGVFWRKSFREGPLGTGRYWPVSAGTHWTRYWPGTRQHHWTRGVSSFRTFL